MKSRNFINNLLILIGFSIISGCSLTSLPSSVQHSIGQSDKDIESASKKIDEAKNSSNKENYIMHTNVGYFGNHAITENNTDFLPPSFNNQIQIDREFFDLRSISSAISDLTGITTTLDLTDPSFQDSQCPNVRITQQSGSVIDLLNQISAKCDLGWDYRDGKIVLSDTETKTWSIKGIPGDIQVQNQIQNNAGAQAQTGTTGGLSTGGGAGGGGGAASTSQTQTQQSATQNTAFNLSNSLWKNLQDAVQLQLSKIGRMSISPSTSTLTVTDKPSVISDVNKYINNQNDKLKRMVIINVALVNVDVNAEDNYGVNWNAVLGSSSSPGQFSINGSPVGGASTSSSTGTSGSSSGSINPVFVPSSLTQAFTFGYNGGSGSAQFLINALSSVTKSSIVTNTAVSTLSNQPVPLQFVDQQSYLASVSNMVVQNVGNQISLTPGQLTTGFSINLLPVVEANNKVDLQVSINLSAVKQISQYSSNGSSIQLPSTIQRNFMQKVVIKSGDTFVMAGFDENQQQIMNNGVGSTTNWWLGGGVTASRKRTRMVMLVTPTVVNI